MSFHTPIIRTSAVDGLFSRLCRATPEEARDLATPFMPSERAALALACNARTHLRHHGRAIASTCSLEALIAEGGQAGRVLFEQVGGKGDTWGMIVQTGRRRISLAG